MSRLRDAAVNPRLGDYLAPGNAGAAGEKGNPHGSHVIAPGLPDDWPSYEAWRAHAIALGCADPGPAAQAPQRPTSSTDENRGAAAERTHDDEN